MNHTVLHFIQTHAADDIILALQTPQYFGLLQTDVLELASFVFRAIDAQKDAIYEG
jgi:hypothetical protein